MDGSVDHNLHNAFNALIALLVKKNIITDEEAKDIDFNFMDWS